MTALTRSSMRSWFSAISERPSVASAIPRVTVVATWTKPAAAVTPRILPRGQFWALPTRTKQSQWLGIRVWRSAMVNVETRATGSLSMGEGL